MLAWFIYSTFRRDCLSNISCRKLCKNPILSENFLDFCFKVYFVIPRLKNLSNRPVVGFHLSSSYVFLNFIQKIVPKCNFFETSKSTLSCEYFQLYGPHQFLPFLGLSMIFIRKPDPTVPE